MRSLQNAVVFQKKKKKKKKKKKPGHIEWGHSMHHRLTTVVTLGVLPAACGNGPSGPTLLDPTNLFPNGPLQHHRDRAEPIDGRAPAQNDRSINRARPVATGGSNHDR